MLGFIGGTGLYRLDQLRIRETIEVDTPFGEPSAPIVIGELNQQTVAFLPRHGLHHQFLPSEINFRANVFALKKIGVRALVGVSAVGSLKQEVAPGHLALPNQYIDLTRGQRAGTFFGRFNGHGIAAHVSTADPVCTELSKWIIAAAKNADALIHTNLVYGCVEGPRLGTRAESHRMRAMGCGFVGMTNAPEVFLAREAQLPYATICIATDYDCWMEDPSQHAQVDKVIELYTANISKVKDILMALTAGAFPDVSQWPSRNSLRYALLTDRRTLSPEIKDWFATLEA